MCHIRNGHVLFDPGNESKFSFPMAGHSSDGASNNGKPTSAISGAAKATSFLANLNPSRWGSSHHNQASNTSGSGATGFSSSPSLHSGYMVWSLLNYITKVGPGRNNRLRTFLQVGYFLKSTTCANGIKRSMFIISGVSSCVTNQ